MRSRYEAKYVITEDQALQVRKYCTAYLPPDRHAEVEHRPCYPILSIYLDSYGRDTLRDAVERCRDRFKLRVRTYRSCHRPIECGPTFLEIKRKTDGLVRKHRAAVPADTAERILWNNGEDAEIGRLPDGSDKNVVKFLELRRRLRAEPTIGVYYVREAYQGISGEGIRVTLDRHLHYGLLAPPSCGHDRWWPLSTSGVILEVKFTDTYPSWVMNMLHRIEVTRRGVCKYVICSRAAGPYVVDLHRSRSILGNALS